MYFSRVSKAKQLLWVQLQTTNYKWGEKCLAGHTYGIILNKGARAGVCTLGSSSCSTYSTFNLGHYLWHANVAEDGPGLWVPAPTWESQRNLASDQLQLLKLFGESTGKWRASLSLLFGTLSNKNQINPKKREMELDQVSRSNYQSKANTKEGWTAQFHHRFETNKIETMGNYTE